MSLFPPDFTGAVIEPARNTYVYEWKPGWPYSKSGVLPLSDYPVPGWIHFEAGTPSFITPGGAPANVVWGPMQMLSDPDDDVSALYIEPGISWSVAAVKLEVLGFQVASESSEARLMVQLDPAASGAGGVQLDCYGSPAPTDWQNTLRCVDPAFSADEHVEVRYDLHAVRLTQVSDLSLTLKRQEWIGEAQNGAALLEMNDQRLAELEGHHLWPSDPSTRSIRGIIAVHGAHETRWNMQGVRLTIWDWA